MRLRALHLSNVRKFAGQRASITGIGDGITVVSEANEFGKSTFFDAIHALFFEKYSSAAKPVKSLQPYSKGAVEIAAEIETDAGLFRIEKSFLQRKSARILRLPSEALVAQDDEAERWIMGALGSDKNGPAGLLWVRQGVTGLESDSKDETAKQLETRRDLLSSVSGEIDAMTGGRRMDRVMARVADELKPLVTATGKPTGAWRALTGEIAEMEDELAALDAQIDKLGAALIGRKQAEGQMAQLDRDDAKAVRTQGLDQAQEALTKAEAHAGRVVMAAQSHKLAQIQAQTNRTKLDAFLAAIEGLAAASVDAQAARAAVASASEECTQRHSELSDAQTTKSATTTAVTTARKALEAARQQAEARRARTLSIDLNNQLQQIEKAQKSRDAAFAFVGASRATQEWLRQVEDAQNAVASQAAHLAAQSVTISVTYTGETRVNCDGAPLPRDEALALSGPTDVTLPGIGTLSIRVPDTGADARAELARLEHALEALLADATPKTVAQARVMAAARAEAVQAGDVAKAILNTLAPDGIDRLRSDKAAADLAALDAHDDPLAPQSTLDTTLAQAETQAATAADAVTRTEAGYSNAREAVIRALASAQSADHALELATSAAGPEDARDALRSDLIRAEAQAVDDLNIQAEALEALRQDAPDLATARAEAKRARDAVQAAATQHQTLSLRVAALSAQIHTIAENGIEESRDTLAGRLDTAQTQATRFTDKARALTRLQTALEAERSAARDTYFGPVQAELKPLLAILYDDAGLQFNSDSLLPSGMTRAETEERLDTLSGGTQEQIAILTRLAFARLFQGQGQHIPIVLDDALVYSDDERIVKMFTALNRVAQDQQILVFTCRTMAFLSLGGTRPEVAIRDL